VVVLLLKPATVDTAVVAVDSAAMATDSTATDSAATK